MPLPLITCDGTQIGSLGLPPFELASGQFVCLHLPIGWRNPEPLVEFLTGRKSVPGLQVHGRVVHAERFSKTRAGLFGCFRQLRATEWLRRESGISAADAGAIVRRLNLGSLRVSQLAGNPRTLLALEVAWAQGAEAVVFSTAGCDPMGVRMVFAAVGSRLGECAAIHYDYPSNYACPPGPKCIPLTCLPDVSTSATATPEAR